MEYLPIKDKVSVISDISHDKEIPLFASNLIYLSDSPDNGMVESKIFYSIINKQTKRADHYWFIHIDHTDAPDQLEYDIRTISPGAIFALTFHVGYRVNPQVNVFLRQVVEDMVRDGSLDLTSSYPSLSRHGIAGDFRFVIIRRLFSASSNCRWHERFLLKMHDRLRWLGISERDAFGLDTSTVKIETVPLILSTAPSRRITRLR